jgi:hypothetical protein
MKRHLSFSAALITAYLCLAPATLAFTIEETGRATVDTAQAKNQAQAQVIALRTARQLAYQQLSDRLAGLLAAADADTRTAIAGNRTIQAFSEGYVRGARVKPGSETTEILEDGSTIAAITLVLDLPAMLLPTPEPTPSSPAIPSTTTPTPAPPFSPTTTNTMSPPSFTPLEDTPATTPAPPIPSATATEITTPTESPPPSATATETTTPTETPSPSSTPAESITATIPPPPVLEHPLTATPADTPAPEPAASFTPEPSPAVRDSMDTISTHTPSHPHALTPLPTATTELRVSPDPAAYTGLIVDTRNTSFVPHDFPALLSTGGKLLYGVRPENIRAAYTHGYIHYVTDMSDPDVARYGGDRPLVIAASGVAGGHAGDNVLVTDADAETIRLADESGKFLCKCRVVLIVTAYEEDEQ